MSIDIYQCKSCLNVFSSHFVDCPACTNYSGSQAHNVEILGEFPRVGHPGNIFLEKGKIFEFRNNQRYSCLTIDKEVEDNRRKLHEDISADEAKLLLDENGLQVIWIARSTCRPYWDQKLDSIKQGTLIRIIKCGYCANVYSGDHTQCPKCTKDKDPKDEILAEYHLGDNGLQVASILQAQYAGEIKAQHVTKASKNEKAADFPDFIKEEYFHLQSRIDSFDDKALTIKGWSVTVAMAGIGAAFIQKKGELFLLSASAAILFWIIEAWWKTFQSMYLARVHEIENYCNGIKIKEFTYPYTSSTFMREFQRQSGRRFSRIFWFPHVLLPHFITTMVGAVLWFLWFIGKINLG